jgi:gluconokinase
MATAINPPLAIVILGVSGAGKTTVGKQLAWQLRWTFIDADDLHTPDNIELMRHGTPLTDERRASWLTRLRELLLHQIKTRAPTVLACSALKKSYREQLRVSDEVRFVYLRGDRALLHARLRARQQHFMKAEMLESQLRTLEEPTNALVVDAALPVDDIVRRVCAAFGLGKH